MERLLGGQIEEEKEMVRGTDLKKCSINFVVEDPPPIHPRIQNPDPYPQDLGGPDLCLLPQTH